MISKHMRKVLLTGGQVSKKGHRDDTEGFIPACCYVAIKPVIYFVYLFPPLVTECCLSTYVILNALQFISEHGKGNWQNST